MKKFFFSMVALMVVAVSFAQNTLIATLSHGDAVKMFFGPSALISANNEAENGDVITLSGGTFACPNFTKGITIRGTGVNARNTTIIENYDNQQINIPQSDDCRFSMEGCIIHGSFLISGESSNIYFLKCKMSSLKYTSSGSAKFVNCDISGFYLSGSGNVKFMNCHLTMFNNQLESSSIAEFLNCLIEMSYGNTTINRSSFVNSILFDSGSGYSVHIPAETQSMNCLSIGISLNGAVSVDCSYVGKSEATDIFKNCRSVTNTMGYLVVSLLEPYELTDEAKTKYLGTDGKEIGLYGGQYPFNLTPNYPRITKLNVAKQTTADNKLSVDIEVSATE